MARRKKIPFKLNPEWMLKEPLDFEYNKYTLLDYLQKCEKNLDRYEIYPDFVELSLHLANVQSLGKENILLLTDKKFESCDDEIFIKDLYPKKPRELTSEESEELDKTIEYSNGKLFDAFNFAKSIWNVAYETVEISLKKNKDNLIAKVGYIFHYEKVADKIFVWEYKLKIPKGDITNIKTFITKIYEESPNDNNLVSIIETSSTFTKIENKIELPIFEMKCNQNFPMEQTIVPIMKRKITSYIFQIVNSEKLNNFDFEI